MKQKLTLGFSPCPNDTFIFDALVNHKIDTEGLDFEVELADVQTLNEWAKAGKLDISKISYGALPLLPKRYQLLKSGGALGRGVGPLLINNAPVFDGQTHADSPEQLLPFISDSVVAIPGVNTTAHFLFSQAFPEMRRKVFLPFNEIEDYVLAGEGPGVIIHENRFTYQEKGLFKLMDLGAFWEEQTGYPIPLGGIVMSNLRGFDLLKKVDRLINKSVAFAFAHYPELPAYVKMHSQEMSEKVMRQHIDLYVNDFSLDMGETGKTAILKLLETLQPGASNSSSIFVE